MRLVVQSPPQLQPVLPWHWHGFERMSNAETLPPPPKDTSMTLHQARPPSTSIEGFHQSPSVVQDRCH